MDVLVPPLPTAEPLADIVITWQGWDDTARAGEAAVAHVFASDGSEEAIEMGHFGQWERHLARVIRNRWPGFLDCRWIEPWRHLRVWPYEEVY